MGRLMFFIIHLSAMFFLTACGGEDGDSNSSSELNSNLLNQDLVNDSFVAKDSNDKSHVIDDSSGKNSKKLDSSFYGKWRYIDTGEQVLILSNSKLDYEIKNKDLLLIKDNSGERRYLMRAGVAKAKIKGKILLDSSQGTKSTKSYSDIGSIEIILQNVVDKDLISKLTAQKNGEFEDSSQPSGTTVKLTATDGNKTFETEINVDSAEVDVGNFVKRCKWLQF